MAPLAKGLTRLGAAVFVAEDAPAVLALQLCAPPAALWVCALSPRNIDTCRWLVAQPEQSQLRILVVGAHDDADGRSAAFRAGCDDHLSLPISHDELAARWRLHRDVVDRPT